MLLYHFKTIVMTGLIIFFSSACAELFIGNLTSNSQHVDHHESIEVKGAWVRAMPLNMKMTAAYMILHNHSSMDDMLISVESPVAGNVETHNVIKKDGTMSMQHVPSILVPANAVQDLKPGGFHLMLVQLKKVPKVGEKVLLVLKFKHAGRKAVIAKVIEGPMEGMKHDSKIIHSQHE